MKIREKQMELKKTEKPVKIDYASEHTGAIQKDIYWLIAVLTIFTLLYIYVL